MNKIKIGNNQTIFDLAIQELGSVEAAFDIIQDNRDILNSNTDNLIIGQEINIRETSQWENKAVKNYYKSNKLRPATADETMKNKGVGYWIIEEDNVVV